ncbi:hypothetical protein [uncultured Flavobacterium sp.]|uniref:hypothetical protein n=1 Tax=uncultured Flavobacterium sp. TaxID=165435 RepID=UPI0025959512|nr:hypothetical protein [uncultured Flavobacterium sp.]
MEVGKELVIEIEGFGIPYKTPPLPPLKEISGYNLPKKDQKWSRPILPDDEQISSYSQEEMLAIIEREFRRRVFGFWFMNNGVPTYLTGSNYFYLTYWFIAAVNEDGYPEHREAVKEWFYVMDICHKDEYCFGAIMGCQKRFGKTEICLADEYNHATLIIKDSLFGMNSLSSTEARNNLFKSRLIRSHKRIPNYLKPVSNETKSKREITSELTFKGTSLGDGRYTKALNNVIDHRPTLVSAYQGKRPAYIFFDEPGSVEEISLIDWWTTVKQQLALGKRIFGKCFLPTTLESMNPSGASDFKELWYKSDITKRDGNGRTESGLYKYFKPHYKGREGFIDEYGFDLVEEAKKFRQNELDNADDNGKMKIKRQYPENEDEMFYVINEDSQLNLQNIQDQIAFNDENKHLAPYGDLEWIDNIRDNELGVRWIPNPNGRWCITKHPTIPNLSIMKGGKRTPNNGVDGDGGMIGIDPISGVKAYSKRKSDLGMFGWDFLKPSEAISDIPAFDYVARTPNPYDGFEDVIKTCVYFGWKAHIERNKEALITHMEMRGYENYMQRRPSFSISEHSENKKDNGYGTPNSSPSWRNTLFTAAKGVIETCCGFQDFKENDVVVRRMSRFYLTRTLKTLQEFKPAEEWNDYDLAVAFMYCVVMRNQYVAPKVEKKKVKINFPKYKIVDGRSVLIK